MRFKAVLNSCFLQVSGRLILSTEYHQLRRCLNNHLSKKSLKSYTIISTENKTDARIHGTIYARHQNGNKGKVFEATRPYVRHKKEERPEYS